MKKQNPPRVKLLFSAAVLAVASFLPALVPTGKVSAAQITTRSLTLQTATTPTDVNLDGLDDGGSAPGANANHRMQFTVPTAANVDAIHFEYCTTAAAVPGGIQCDAPTGLDASTADLGNDGGTGWAITNQTASTVTVSGTEIVSPGLQGAKTFRLDDVVNPSATNTTFFIRITTYTGGTSGTAIDTGTVAASTAEPIILSGDMPESLIFCTGRQIDESGANVPDCSTVTTGDVSFNKLFTPEEAAWATSQMAASTNASTGYAITVNGPTMTSGGNTITAIGNTSAVSLEGTSQFGMNVVENDEPNTVTASNPAVVPASADVTTPTGNALHNGQAVAPYATGGDDTTAEFAYQTGNTVANSNTAASDSQVFTVTYMVNVPGSQPAGTYSTTLTYICTAVF